MLGQRLYFQKKTKQYYNGIKVDTAKCVACGLCASLCPMNNIEVKNGAVKFNDKCTMCYRCFSNCPKQAITLLGNTVIEQCRFDKYKNE